MVTTTDENKDMMELLEELNVAKFWVADLERQIEALRLEQEVKEPIFSIPGDAWKLIFKHLRLNDIQSCAHVCHQWRIFIATENVVEQAMETEILQVRQEIITSVAESFLSSFWDHLRLNREEEEEEEVADR